MKYRLLINACFIFFSFPLFGEISLGNHPDVSCVCIGNPQQAFTVTAEGSAGPFTFEWAGPEGYTSTQKEPIDIEIGGTYTLKVTNAYQCIFEYHINVPACEGPTFNFETEPTSYCDPMFGEISLFLDDDETNFQIKWYKDNVWLEEATEEAVGEFFLTNIEAGTYHAELIDIDGDECLFTSPTVVVETIPEIVITSTITSSCLGGTTGSIDITVTGGASPLTFQWDNGETTEDLNGIGVDAYTVTVTDNDGCEKEEQFVVSPSSTLGDITTSTIPPSCNGASDGSIELFIEPPGDYLIQWNTGQTGYLIENLSSGSYSATITDPSTACIIGNYSDILSAPMVLNASIVQAIDASCNISSDGSLILQVDGGTPPYSFAWNGGNGTSPEISGLLPGVYDITVTDNNMCTTETITGVVGVDVEGLQLSFSTQGVQCASGPEGSIQAMVSQGSGNYSYLWTKEGDPVFSETGNFIEDLDIGTYCVTVTDNDLGCTVSDCTTLEATGEWPFIEQVQILAGTTLIYEASWLQTTNGCLIFQGGNTNAFTNAVLEDMENGLLNLTITAQSNIELANLSLSFPDFLSLSSILNSANGLEWIFEIAALDVPGIISSSTIDLQLLFSGLSTTNLPLYDFIGAGGTNTCIQMPSLQEGCSWVPSPIINPAGDNGIDLVHKLKKGCESIVFNTFSEEGKIELIIGNPTDIDNINWIGLPSDAIIENQGLIVSNLATGMEYCVLVEFIDGCIVEDCVYLCKPLPGAYTIDVFEPCVYVANPVDDGMICITVDDGLIVKWLGGPENENCWDGLATGTYTAVISDLICDQSLTLEIDVDPVANPTVFLETATPACPAMNNGTLTVSVDGGRPPYSFLWEDGQTTNPAIGLGVGLWGVTVSDDCGQFAVPQYFAVPNYTAVTIDSYEIDEACTNSTNGGIDLIVSGGVLPFSFLWEHSDGEIPPINTTTPSINHIPGGIYTVIVTDACGGVDDITIEIPSLPPPQYLWVESSTITPSCVGGENGTIDITLNSNNPWGNAIFYAWSNGETTEDVMNLNPGVYTVTTSNSEGCSYIKTFVVPTIEPDITANATINDVCAGAGSIGSISLDVSGGNPPFTFEWNTGATTSTIENLSSGAYWLTITDAIGCTIFESYSVAFVSSPDISLETTIIDDCRNMGIGSIEITNATGEYPPFTYQWYNGPTGTVYDNLDMGGYLVSITDSRGCIDTKILTVNNVEFDIDATVTPSCEFPSNGAIAIQVNDNGYGMPFSYSWDDGQTTDVVNNLPSGNYCVSVTSSSDNCTEVGCFDILEVESPRVLRLDVQAPILKKAKQALRSLLKAIWKQKKADSPFLNS